MCKTEYTQPVNPEENTEVKALISCAGCCRIGCSEIVIVKTIYYFSFTSYAHGLVCCTEKYTQQLDFWIQVGVIARPVHKLGVVVG